MKFKSLIAVAVVMLTAVTARTQNNEADSSTTVRHFLAPAYPAIGWLARIQGTVVTEVTIKADGKVDSVKFISAHAVFRKPVETALKEWLFQPLSRPATIRITIRFQLDTDCPLTGSDEPDKRYYPQTLVSADLPSTIEVRTCSMPITITNTEGVTIATSPRHPAAAINRVGVAGNISLYLF